MMKPSDTATKVTDQVIAEVHHHKRAIMAEHDDDLEKLLKDLRIRQKANPRLVAAQPPTATVRDEQT